MIYSTRKELKLKYPQGGYEIIGVKGNGLKEKIGTYQYKEEIIDYYKIQYNKLYYKIEGYIDCGNNQYIEVIKDQRKVRLMILIICIVIISIIICFIPRNNEIENASNFIPTEEMIAIQNKGAITFPSFIELKMESDQKEIEMNLYNPKENDVYFVYTIFVDTVKCYQSKYIKPGKGIKDIEFIKDIPYGEREVLIKIQTYTMDDHKKELNSIQQNTKLQAIYSKDWEEMK